MPTHFPTLPYPYPHFSTPHTSFLTSPHTPTHFPTPPPTPPIPLSTAPLTSPYTLPHSPHALSHIFPHSFDDEAKLPCDDVTLTPVNSTGLWKSPIKFFTTTGNLKSYFGVGNVSFRCMKVWRSYWQPRSLPPPEQTTLKLLLQSADLHPATSSCSVSIC